VAHAFFLLEEGHIFLCYPNFSLLHIRKQTVQHKLELLQAFLRKGETNGEEGARRDGAGALVTGAEAGDETSALERLVEGAFAFVTEEFLEEGVGVVSLQLKVLLRCWQCKEAAQIVIILNSVESDDFVRVMHKWQLAGEILRAVLVVFYDGEAFGDPLFDLMHDFFSLGLQLDDQAHPICGVEGVEKET